MLCRHAGVRFVETDQQQRRVEGDGIHLQRHRALVRLEPLGHVGDKLQDQDVVDGGGKRDFAFGDVDANRADAKEARAELFDDRRRGRRRGLLRGRRRHMADERHHRDRRSPSLPDHALSLLLRFHAPSAISISAGFDRVARRLR
jgi:hypothetical protein